MANRLRPTSGYRIEVTQDGKPQITLEEPQRDLEVTTDAVVPIRALVKDDYGIASVAMRYYESIGVRTASDTNAPPSKIHVPIYDPSLEELSLSASHFWELAPLNFQPGTVLRMDVAATDRRDVPGPNLGSSREVRLLVVSKEDFLRAMENEQKAIREEMERTLDMQDQANKITDDLKNEAEQIGSLDREKSQQLQSVEWQQRRIRQRIDDQRQGIRSRIQETLDRLENNRLSDSDLAKQMKTISQRMKSMSENELPDIAKSLTDANKENRMEQANQNSRSPKNDSNNNDAKNEDESKTGNDSSSKKDEGNRTGESSNSESNVDSDEVKKPAEQSSGQSAGKKNDGKAAQDKDGKPQAGDGKQDKAGKPQDSNETDASAEEGSEQKNEGKPQSENSQKGSDREKQDRPKDRPKDVSKKLNSASQNQKKVMRSLAQMVDQMQQWESVAEVTNDAQEIKRDQDRIGEQVRQAQEELFGKNEKDLTDREKAELAKLSDRQSQLRDRMRRLRRKYAGHVRERS